MTFERNSSINEFIGVDKNALNWLRFVIVPLFGVSFSILSYAATPPTLMSWCVNKMGNWYYLYDTAINFLLTLFGSELCIIIYRVVEKRGLWERNPALAAVWQFSLTLFLSLFFIALNLFAFQYWITVEIEVEQFVINEVYLVTVTIGLLMSTFYTAFFFFQNWRKLHSEAEALKRRAVEAELVALKEQLDPHFLFNSLNTLAALVEENPKQAVEFIQKLSQAYRYVLQRRDASVVTLREELEFAETYTYLLKQRFGENLRINIHVPAENLSFGIVPMALQLLIENAVKHNIVSREKPLCIDITSVNGRLCVKNNLQRKTAFETSTGVGLKNIIGRYKLLAPTESVIVEKTSRHFSVTLPLLLLD